MKKIVSLLVAVLLCAAVFGGCADIDYMYQRDNFGMITRRYNVRLNELVLSGQFDIETKEMKEFLFRFFGKVTGKDLTKEEYQSDYYVWQGQGEYYGIIQEIIYDEEYFGQPTVIFIQTFESEEALGKYIGEDDSGEGDNNDIQVETNFFFHTVTQKVSVPFFQINDAFDREEPRSGSQMDLIDIFMWGHGEFEGFRNAFPQVKKDDLNLLIYNFILAFSNMGYSSPDADKIERESNMVYLIWEDVSNSPNTEVTLVRIVPNTLGWNVMGLVFTAIFAFVLFLIWRNQQNNKKVTSIPYASPYSQYQPPRNYTGTYPEKPQSTDGAAPVPPNEPE